MAPLVREPGEVNRLLSRLFIEYTAEGWSYWTLAKHAGVHPSVLKRWENGEVTNPLLSIVVAVATSIGRRLDFVAPHHAPLVNLDEFEVQALIEGAAVGWTSGQVESGSTTERQLLSALRKLGKIKEASDHV